MGIVRGPVQEQTDPSALAPRRPDYYTARDVAEMCGVCENKVYRPAWRERQYQRAQMPRPYMDRPLRWDRTTMDLWKRRFMPGAPQQAPANDDDVAKAPGQPMTAEDYRARLHTAYQRAPAASARSKQ